MLQRSRKTGKAWKIWKLKTPVYCGEGGKTPPFCLFCKFLAGSFSAASKRNFARKYAFDSIFQALQDLHPFAPLQSQNFRKKKIGLKRQQFSWDFSTKKMQMSQNLQNFVKFQKCQLENLVDFEKCCKTHIFLQKSEPIQPKTSNILPKICSRSRAVLTLKGGRYGMAQQLRSVEMQELQVFSLGQVCHIVRRAVLMTAGGVIGGYITGC